MKSTILKATLSSGRLGLYIKWSTVFDFVSVWPSMLGEDSVCTWSVTSVTECVLFEFPSYVLSTSVAICWGPDCPTFPGPAHLC
jgi:hypothetical protein